MQIDELHSRVAMVPARIGSERLSRKNLRMLGDKPILAHAIAAAKASGVFDRVVVNGDDPIFGHVAEAEGAEFYLRPAHLGKSDARSDDVVADFIEHHPCRVVAWVNPTSPLQPSAEVAAVVRHFEREGLDSLITTRREPFHVVFEGRPLNFDPDGKFARTQDLTPVSVFVYSVMMWRVAAFLKSHKATGHALMTGRFGTFDVSPASCLILKTEENLALIQAAYLTSKRPKDAPRYFECPDEPANGHLEPRLRASRG
jgi:CMP-N-acetylneuraminic acid synthetase